MREVWLARPELAEKLLAASRAHTDANITYYTHDLHHLRLQRQAELHADPELKVEATKLKVLECEIFRSVDRVTTPSAAEAELVRPFHRNTCHGTAALPLRRCRDIHLRRRALHRAFRFVFVGGFPHAPNVDAAVFIAKEVMPLVWRECPEVRLLLIGYAPPRKCKHLQAPAFW